MFGKKLKDEIKTIYIKTEMVCVGEFINVVMKEGNDRSFTSEPQSISNSKFLQIFPINADQEFINNDGIKSFSCIRYYDEVNIPLSA